MAFTARTETYADVPNLSDPYDLSINKPAGTLDGDILFCWIGVWVFAFPPTIDSVPAGWTLLGSYGTAFDNYYLYYKIASSEPASWTWSFSASYKVRMVCSCYTSGDFNAADPIDVVSNTGYRLNDTIVRAASMNVASANSPLIFWAGLYYITSATTYTPPANPAGWVEDDDAGAVASDFYLEICSMIWGGSGATGNMDATNSIGGADKHAFAVALKPAGGPPPPAGVGKTAHMADKMIAAGVM